MTIVTLARAARYASVDIAPTYSGDPTADYGTAAPGGSLTVTLPTATGISQWRVSFTRRGAPEEFSEALDNLPPATTSASYIYKAADAGYSIEPQVTAVPLSAGYASRVWTLTPQEVTGTPDPGWPADWSESLVTWEQRVFEGGQGKGQMVISASAPANPAGYELTAFHGTSSSSSSVSVNAVFVKTLTELGLNAGNLGSSEITWSPNSGAPSGSYDVLSLGYKKTSTGELRQFAWVKSFLAAGSPIPSGPPGTVPPANQVLSEPTQAALIAALNARIATGSTAPWIIELPTGNYGRLSLGGLIMPGRTTLRSQDRAALGARFLGSTLTNCTNLYFEFCDFNLQGSGFTTSMNEWFSVRNVGISYSRLGAPEINRDSLGVGYVERIRYSIRIDHRTEYGYSNNILIHENLFSGVVGEPIYLNGLNVGVVSNNVAENVCGDFMMFGHVTDVDVINNWGSRIHYPSWDPNARGGAGDFYHSDMCQMWTSAPSRRVRYIGNVFIAGKHPTLPGITRQGILIQGDTGDFVFRNNLIVTNCFQGIWVEHANAGGHSFENNALLRIIDLPSSQGSTYYKAVVGTNPITWIGNIQQHTAGWPGVTNIAGGGTDYTASLAYYTNPRAEIGGTMSSYYDMRPVDGAVTDWDYAGTPIGPAARFREVIVDGLYPKVGPAATAWKAWYNPKNQITS